MALAAALALAPLAAAGAAPKGPIWPPPPAEPCIAYVESMSRPVDIGVKRSAFRWLANQITGSSAASRDLVKPFGLALDEAGNLLVTDTGANAVCYLDREHKKWFYWDRLGKIRFQSPVAIARHGRTFFVADTGLGKVLAFRQDGKVEFEIRHELERPAGLAIFQDRIYVADASRHALYQFSVRGDFRSKFGQRGAKPGQFNYPTHVSVDAAGRVYVTDSLNFRIQVFDASGRFVRAIGSAGDGPGQFSRPKGVAVSPAGHIYAVDALFDNVQIFDAEGRLLLNWGESGAGPGQFWLPNAIAISRDNLIYVTDSYNHRIQVFKYIGHP